MKKYVESYDPTDANSLAIRLKKFITFKTLVPAKQEKEAVWRSR